MRTPTLLIAAAGLVLGAGLMLLLPNNVLFVTTHADDPEAEDHAAGERWACPMMDFIGTKPGKCPVCGMTLTKVTAGELTREQQRRMEVHLSPVTEGPARSLVRAYGIVRYDERTWAWRPETRNKCQNRT